MLSAGSAAPGAGVGSWEWESSQGAGSGSWKRELGLRVGAVSYEGTLHLKLGVGAGAQGGTVGQEGLRL